MSTWKELIKEHENEIYEAIKDAKKNTFGCQNFSHMDVEMDDTGDVCTTGLHSQNWQTQSSYFGKTIRLAIVYGWDVDDNNDLTDWLDTVNLRDACKAALDDNYPMGSDIMGWLSDAHPDLVETCRKALKDTKNNARDYEIDEYMGYVDIDAIIRELNVEAEAEI
jgi:hypothetical protein